MTDNKPTLHHLNNSQSQRILWLLEELAIDYTLTTHTRLPNFRAPQTLTSISPSGKAPLLITGAADNHRLITESSAIITYLLRTFDTSRKFTSEDWIRDEILCSQIQSEAPVRFALFLDLGIIRAEGPMAGLATSFSGLGELEKALGESEGGFLGGERPGRADFLMEWSLSMVSQRGWADLEAFPRLKGWLERVYEREAWNRGLERGNGYDLRVFPKVEGR